MNRLQKMAWLNVGCCGTALVLSGIATVILYYFFGFPVAMAGFAFMGILGITGLGPVLFRKDSGRVSVDERDHLYNAKASLISFALSYTIFILICMGLWVYYRLKGIETISIDFLAIIIWPLAIMAILGHAVIILVLYGKDHQQTERGAV